MRVPTHKYNVTPIIFICEIAQARRVAQLAQYRFIVECQLGSLGARQLVSHWFPSWQGPDDCRVPLPVGIRLVVEHRVRIDTQYSDSAIVRVESDPAKALVYSPLRRIMRGIQSGPDVDDYWIRLTTRFGTSQTIEG